MVKEDKKDSLYATLSKRKPTLIDSQTIELVVDNKVQEDYINTIKNDLMEFLRQELNNFHLQFKLKVKEVKDEQMLYTGKEKFNKMAESNPTLKLLQQKLKLMVE